jgi:hypothetical protein
MLVLRLRAMTSHAVIFLATTNLSVADCQSHEGVATDETLSYFSDRERCAQLVLGLYQADDSFKYMMWRDGGFQRVQRADNEGVSVDSRDCRF